MNVCGRIIEVMPPMTGKSASGREWKKQNFVIEIYEDQPTAYPRRLSFTHWGDRYVQNIVENAEVTVFFDLESREYNGRWYTDAKSYRIDMGVQIDGMGAAAQPMTQPMTQSEPAVQPQSQPLPDMQAAGGQQDALPQFNDFEGNLSSSFDDTSDDLPF